MKHLLGTILMILFTVFNHIFGTSDTKFIRFQSSAQQLPIWPLRVQTSDHCLIGCFSWVKVALNFLQNINLTFKNFKIV